MNRIRDLRKEKKMSQQDLADKLGVDRTAVVKWESNTHMPRTGRLLQIAKILDCSVDEIVSQ